MKKKYSLFGLFVLFVLYGCTESGKKEETEYRVIQVPFGEKEQILNMSEVIDSIRYIPLETSSDNLIGSVNKLIPLGDKIIVMDNDNSNAIYVFDNQGKFLVQIARRGVAPGEYVSLGSVAADEEGNRIFIYDGSARNLLIYSLDGEYMGQERIDFVVHEIEYIGNDRLACYSGYANTDYLTEKGKKPNLIIFDLKDKKAKGSVYVDNRIDMSEVTAPILALSRYVPNTDATLISPLDNSVYRVDANGANKAYEVNFGDGDEKKRQSYIRRLKEEELSAVDIYEKYRPDFCGMNLCARGKDFLYLNYTNQKDGIIGWGIYRIHDGSYTGGQAIAKYPIKNDVDGFFPLMPIAVKDNEMYGVVEASMLDGIENAKTDRLQELKNSVSSEDNPILMVGYVKVR